MSIIRKELETSIQFLNEFQEILRTVCGLKDTELCHVPVQIFDEETINVCLKIYHENMEYLSNTGELDPY